MPLGPRIFAADLLPEDNYASQVGWSATSLRRAHTVTFPDERNAATTYLSYSASAEEMRATNDYDLPHHRRH
ncbi:hypothetical protein, partial [Mycobacterium sp.]|uniref:hypothetical protein n=1 Tax=Mycobacterium sp. TaxID=1785 RepID=UPI003F9D21EF